MSVEKLSNALDTIVNAMAEKYPLGTDFERYNDEIRTIVSWASDYLETLEQAGDRAKALDELKVIGNLAMATTLCIDDEDGPDEDERAEIAERIETVRQALLLPMWMPINDAPRDGTKILLYVPKAEKWEAFHFLSYWHRTKGKNGYWWDHSHLDPTHWMPLPAAPDSDGGV